MGIQLRSEWQKQLPFWSESTIKRIISKLRKSGLIVTGNYNKAAMDKTLWYRIDHEALVKLELSSVQNDPTIVSDCTDGEGQSDPTNTRDYHKTNTENTAESMPFAFAREEPPAHADVSVTKELPKEQISNKGATKHPAVLAYQEVFRRKPNTAQCVRIAKKDPDIERWRKVLEHGADSHYNPTNLKWMFDIYEHPERMQQRGTSNGYSNRSTVDPSSQEFYKDWDFTYHGEFG